MRLGRLFVHFGFFAAIVEGIANELELWMHCREHMLTTKARYSGCESAGFERNK